LTRTTQAGTLFVFDGFPLSHGDLDQHRDDQYTGHSCPLVGILILIMPRFLNYLVAIYLIVVGLFGLGVLR